MALQSLSNNFNSDLHIFFSKLTINYFKSYNLFSKDCRNRQKYFRLTLIIHKCNFLDWYQWCYLFLYSSSKGTIRFSDMRSAALCDNHAKRKGFFSINFETLINLDGKKILIRQAFISIY